jgi:hypothetical protein
MRRVIIIIVTRRCQWCEIQRQATLSEVWRINDFLQLTPSLECIAAEENASQ